MGVTIGARLKAFRMRTGVKMPQVAAATGISKESLYKWEKGTKPSDFEQVKKLEAYIDSEELKYQSNQPYRDPVAHAAESGVAVTIQHNNMTTIEADQVATLTDESMAPFYKPGWRLCLKLMVNPRKLVWGKVYYIIDVNNQGILRRVYATGESNEIKLVSSLPGDYPDIIRTFDELIAVYAVVAILL